ncbi:hypothetical protein [Comamonas avium]|uniref:Uncharacterized protein n=1 Tax=Comamonas avium TaxID=2762231 RepID=A0ABR8SAH0_9BURK|nr:hypothetical protein [Comamonas avium]MBD7960474.1 hypothetical protein [Comamonas avium]
MALFFCVRHRRDEGQSLGGNGDLTAPRLIASWRNLHKRPLYWHAKWLAAPHA